MAEIPAEELTNEPHWFNGKSMYLDPEGNPMGLKDWSDAFSDSEARTLAIDTVGRREVRTMWLGVADGDYLLGTSDNPKIFGSIVCTHDMPIDGMSLEEATKLVRGAFGREILTGTRQDALAAHAALLAELRQEEES